MMGRGMMGTKEVVARSPTLGLLVPERLQHYREEPCTPWNTSVAAKTVLQREKSLEHRVSSWNSAVPTKSVPKPSNIAGNKKGQTRQPAIYKNS